jgi:hypothetical protein
MGASESRKVIPIACTLPGEDMGDRLGEWAAVLARAERREPTDAGMRLQFPADPALLASVAELSAKEADCCAFFTFTVTIEHGAATLDVAAPPDGREVLLALFAS